MWRIKKFLWCLFLCNHNVNETLDLLLKVHMKTGIKSVDEGYHHINVVFNSGAVLKAWNANKYYAWLSDGSITYTDNKFTWADVRPKRGTMYDLKCLLTGYFLLTFAPK